MAPALGPAGGILGPLEDGDDGNVGKKPPQARRAALHPFLDSFFWGGCQQTCRGEEGSDAEAPTEAWKRRRNLSQITFGAPEVLGGQNCLLPSLRRNPIWDRSGRGWI